MNSGRLGQYALASAWNYLLCRDVLSVLPIKVSFVCVCCYDTAGSKVNIKARWSNKCAGCD